MQLTEFYLFVLFIYSSMKKIGKEKKSKSNYYFYSSIYFIFVINKQQLYQINFIILTIVFRYNSTVVYVC